MSTQAPLLSVDLAVDFPEKSGVLRSVSFHVEPGEVLGLVGRSGSGKSTLALAILGLLGHRGGVARGQVVFEGRDVLKLGDREMRGIRGRRMALVLQSPLASLNPHLKLATQFREAWHAHANGAGGGWKARTLELFPSVSLPAEESFLQQYPAQLSVGLAQRALIAMALLHRPSLLIADEPTSALDAITQSEVLALFRRLSRELNMAMLFISHDLLSVAGLCDRVAILNEGEIVETGPTAQIFHSPAHPYTRRLIDALPRPPRAIL